MKLFRMNDCDWVMAPSLDEAANFYAKYTAGSYEDAMKDEPRELTDEEMDKLRFMDHADDPEPSRGDRSFREELARRMATADENETDLFATTEY